MAISAHFASSCEADNNNLLLERVGDDYYRELVCESAIDPQVALERGYDRVQNDWPHLVNDLGFPRKWFADYWIEPKGCDCHGGELFWPYWAENNQVGLPALVVPRRSPDGERLTYEIKPKTHSFKDDRKYINAPNQELILDIHPRGFKHLQDIDTPVWITEGAKKADSLTSLGLFAINISGVWGFQQKKLYGEDNPVLPCFDYIEWEGRQVILAFDADAMTNQNIQDSLSKLNGVLQERGADVLVIYTPPVGGDNSAGIDDYLASGDDPVGLLHGLLVGAAPYTPIDITHEKLARSPELKEAISTLGNNLVSDNWKREETSYSLLKTMIREAIIKGEMVNSKIMDDEEEVIERRCIRFKASYRHLAEQIGVNQKHLIRHIENLERRGLIKRDKETPRDFNEPGSFLLIPGVWPDGGNSGREREETPVNVELLLFPSHIATNSPHPLRLRNSIPASNPRRGVTPGTRKVRDSTPPVGREGISRLGKSAEYLIDMILIRTEGGTDSISEETLARVTHYSDRRALTTSRLFRKLLSAGITETKDHQVRLTSEWWDSVRRVREEGAEDLADQRQREAHEQQRREFKERREVTK